MMSIALWQTHVFFFTVVSLSIGLCVGLWVDDQSADSNPRQSEIQLGKNSVQFLPSKREFIHGGKKREDDKRVFLHSKRLDDAPWQRLNSDVDQEKRIFLHSKRGDEVDNGFADLLKRYLSSPFHQNFLEIVSEDPEDRNLDSKRAFLHGKRTFLHSKRPADREEYAELYEGNNLASNPDKKNFLHGKRLFLHSKRKSTDPVEEKRIFLHSKRDDDDDDLNRV